MHVTFSLPPTWWECTTPWSHTRCTTENKPDQTMQNYQKCLPIIFFFFIKVICQFKNIRVDLLTYMFLIKLPSNLMKNNYMLLTKPVNKEYSPKSPKVQNKCEYFNPYPQYSQMFVECELKKKLKNINDIRGNSRLRRRLSLKWVLLPDYCPSIFICITC